MYIIEAAVTVANLSWIVLSVIIVAIIIIAAICLVRTLRCKAPHYEISERKDCSFEPNIDRYAESLSKMIQFQTVSNMENSNIGEMRAFQEYVKKRYPLLEYKCDFTDINGGMLIKWEGKDSSEPLLMMSHLDVVPASGTWTEKPFGGVIKDGVIWGRGAVDTKGNLCAIFEACESLVEDNYAPLHDIYIFASSREEIGGADAPSVAKFFKDSNIRPKLVIDEGGAILDNPLVGVKGRFAMIAMSESAGCKMLIKTKSRQGKTAMVRLAKFMINASKLKLAKSQMSPETLSMFKTLAPFMNFPMRFIFANMWLFKFMLLEILPKISAEAKAMIMPKLDFYPTSLSDNKNIEPNEAAMIARISATFYVDMPSAVNKLKAYASKLGVEVVMMEERKIVEPEPIGSDAYAIVAETVRSVFAGVIPSPFIQFGGTDARHFVSIAGSVIRFAPLHITREEFGTFHNVDERIHADSLAGAVRFFRELIKRI